MNDQDKKDKGRQAPSTLKSFGDDDTGGCLMMLI